MSIFTRKPPPIVAGDAACRAMVREGLSGLTPPQRYPLIVALLAENIEAMPDLSLKDAAALVNEETHRRIET